MTSVKHSVAFQEHVRSNSEENKPDHSSAGAQWSLSLLCKRAEQIGDGEIERIAKLIAHMISHCVVGHHSGLLNGISVGDGTSLEHRLTKTVEPYLNNISPEISKKQISWSTCFCLRKILIISVVGLILTAIYLVEMLILCNLQ